MDGDAELVAIPGEAARDVDAHALSDVVKDLLVAAFVTDEQEPQAVVAHHFQRIARHVGLGVARPGDAQLAQLARDRLGARPVVREGVVVEEELPHLREGGFRPADFVDDVADAAGAVAMAADGLRPQTERAARFASAPRVERQIGMLEVADEIILDGQIALVDRRDERQLVHVLQNGAWGIVPDRAGGVAIGQSGDAVPVPSLGDFPDGEVEFVAGDEIDDRRTGQAGVWLDRHLGAHKARLQVRIGGLKRLDHADIGGE